MVSQNLYESPQIQAGPPPALWHRLWKRLQCFQPLTLSSGPSIQDRNQYARLLGLPSMHVTPAHISGASRHLAHGLLLLLSSLKPSSYLWVSREARWAPHVGWRWPRATQQWNLGFPEPQRWCLRARGYQMSSCSAPVELPGFGAGPDLCAMHGMGSRATSLINTPRPCPAVRLQASVP